MRTVEWNYDRSEMLLIDQRLLPGKFEINSYKDYQEVSKAISDMVVRGAPAIGATAAFGLAIAALQSQAQSVEGLVSDLRKASRVLEESRPTAINLRWALKRIMRIVNDFKGELAELRQVVLSEAQKIADEDVEINKRMALHGSQLIEDGDTVIHHCNTGALATVDWGTALGVIRMAFEQGKNLHVLVDETRPRLQGARLTAWELQRYGIPHDVISDNAAGYFLSTGQVQKIFFGADRVAANGDVVNKIGTYMLALAGNENNVPTYAVVPSSTVDLSMSHGRLIPIEERDPSEVLNLQWNNKPITPKGTSARNPAFDITPHHLISAIVTENGIIKKPYSENLKKIVLGN